MKNALINLALLLGVTVLFFGGIELTLQITGLQTVKPNPPKIYQKNENPQISYELIPNISRKAYRQKVTTNSLGFRSPELDPDKETVIVLGDSIAFGYGIADEETLAEMLRERIPEYNWLNAAAPGYHLGMQTALYEEKLEQLDPSMLMLVFHYNDFDDQTGWLDDLGIIRAPDWESTETECAPINQGLLQYLPGRCWLDLHSAFYKAVKKFVNARYAREALAETREVEEVEKPEDTITDDDIRRYVKQLDTFLRVVPNDIPRVFVIWPDRYLHEESRPKLIANVKMREFEVIDLYETFGNQVEVLGWDTVHPSANAVKEAAEVIAKHLQDI